MRPKYCIWQAKWWFPLQFQGDCSQEIVVVLYGNHHRNQWQICHSYTYSTCQMHLHPAFPRQPCQLPLHWPKLQPTMLLPWKVGAHWLLMILKIPKGGLLFLLIPSGWLQECQLSGPLHGMPRRRRQRQGGISTFSSTKLRGPPKENRSNLPVSFCPWSWSKSFQFLLSNGKQ